MKKEKNVETGPQIKKVVFKNTELKEMLVEFVGTKHDKEEVTVEMIVETMAKEFPEFLLAIAEENWIRGYQQALFDSEQDESFFENAEGISENDEIHS